MNNNNSKEISKNEFLNILKLSTWISGEIRYNKNKSRWWVTILFEEKMKKKISKYDLILEELRKINSRLDNIENRMENIESEARKHDWNV